MAEAHRGNPKVSEKELKNAIREEVFFSITGLAERVGVSREAMRKRVKALEEEGYVDKREMGQMHIYHRPMKGSLVESEKENRIEAPQYNVKDRVVGNNIAPQMLAVGFMIVTLAANMNGITSAANVALAGLVTYYLHRNWTERR